jgi:hypothetical protein
MPSEAWVLQVADTAWNLHVSNGNMSVLPFQHPYDLQWSWWKWTTRTALLNRCDLDSRSNDLWPPACQQHVPHHYLKLLFHFFGSSCGYSVTDWDRPIRTDQNYNMCMIRCKYPYLHFSDPSKIASDKTHTLVAKWMLRFSCNALGSSSWVQDHYQVILPANNQMRMMRNTVWKALMSKYVPLDPRLWRLPDCRRWKR